MPINTIGPTILHFRDTEYLNSMMQKLQKLKENKGKCDKRKSVSNVSD